MTRNLCPGDSGGPVFVNGSVVWVNSAYYPDSGNDIFAEAGVMHQSLNQYADQLSTRGTSAVLSEIQRSQNAGQQSGSGSGHQGGQTQNRGGQTQHQGGQTQNQGGQNDQTQDDLCEQNGYYGDQYCDEDCPQPDPDCKNQGQSDHGDTQSGYGDTGHSDQNGGDICEQEGYYNDGICDDFCAKPDPDCGAQQSSDSYGNQEGGHNAGNGDVCELEGYYNDGVCDTFCDYYDPDCDSAGYEDDGYDNSDDYDDYDDGSDW